MNPAFPVARLGVKLIEAFGLGFRSYDKILIVFQENVDRVGLLPLKSSCTL